MRSEINAEIQKVRTMLEANDKTALLTYLAGDVDAAAAATVARARARRSDRGKRA